MRHDDGGQVASGMSRRARYRAAAALVALGIGASAFTLIRGGADTRRPSAPRERDAVPANVARIAYSSGGDLWVVEPGGRGRQRITETPDWVEFDPSLSPDGRQIAYRRELRAEGPSTGGSEVWAVDIATGRERRISPEQGGESPAWSPDGERIALSNRTGIALVGPEGGEPTPLNVAGSCPTWSPDGTRIAYCGAGPSGGTSLEIVSDDGSGKVVVLSDEYENFIGAWSPNGTRLTFSSNRRGDLDVYTIRTDGTGLRRVVGGPGAQAVNAWLRDGRLIFADSPSDEETSDWKSIRPDGTDLKRLTFLDGAADPLDWRASPSGLAGSPAISTRP